LHRKPFKAERIVSVLPSQHDFSVSHFARTGGGPGPSALYMASAHPPFPLGSEPFVLGRFFCSPLIDFLLYPPTLPPSLSGNLEGAGKDAPTNLQDIPLRKTRACISPSGLVSTFQGKASATDECPPPSDLLLARPFRSFQLIERCFLDDFFRERKNRLKNISRQAGRSEKVDPITNHLAAGIRRSNKACSSNTNVVGLLRGLALAFSGMVDGFCMMECW
jgi:hypothetical protein